MKKILVTGVAGFIGSHLAEALLKCGYSVLGIDNFSNGKQQNIEYLNQLDRASAFRFIEGDLRDESMCETICDGIDVIYHQAALGSVPRSIKEPKLYFDNNLGGMVNLLEASRKQNISRFIFASSSSVYGDTPKLPKVETMPLNPKSPYALSKAAGENYLRIYQDVYGLETIGFRYFNVFGPRQDPFSQYAAVIPKFFDQCFSKQAITINGDGLQTRDFTFIENVVQFNIKAMEASTDATNRVYNVGCGAQKSVVDLAKKIREITDADVELKYNNSRPGDVRDSLADIELARKYLSVDHITSFDDGLKQTLGWYQNQLTNK